MDVSQVRRQMATQMSVISDVQVNPYALAQPTPPGIQILPPSVAYDTTMHRGIDEWTFIVQGFVAVTTDIGSQALLDDMCAPTGFDSVKAALEADTSLGGLVDDLRVQNQSPGRIVDTPGGGSPMLLVEWQVQVFARGT